jgi:glycosyltransferase involved in cell wall biosynthesis
MAREYSRMGHEVVVVTAKPHGTPEYESVSDIPVHRLTTTWLKLGRLSFNYSLPFVTRIQNIKRLRAIFDSFDPDVVHQNGQFFDLTIISSILAKRRAKPRVLTIHTPLTHTGFLPKIFIAFVDRLFLAPLVRMGQVSCFAVDKFTMDLSNRRYFPRSSQVGFLPASLNPDQFVDGDGRKIRSRLNLDSKKVILSFGHVIPIRNRVALVAALPEILVRIPNAHVVVVGQVYDNEFLELADQLNVTQHITVVGKVPHSDVPDYIAAADIECHDVNGHGLGITTFEVMAAGVPIVASVEEDVFPNIDLKNWPAINIHPHLTPSELANEIARTLSLSDQESKVMINQQRDFVVSQFSSHKVAEKYIEVFAQLTD